MMPITQTELTERLIKGAVVRYKQEHLCVVEQYERKKVKKAKAPIILKSLATHEMISCTLADITGILLDVAAEAVNGKH